MKTRQILKTIQRLEKSSILVQVDNKNNKIIPIVPRCSENEFITSETADYLKDAKLMIHCNVDKYVCGLKFNQPEIDRLRFNYGMQCDQLAASFIAIFWAFISVVMPLLFILLRLT